MTDLTQATTDAVRTDLTNYNPVLERLAQSNDLARLHSYFSQIVLLGERLDEVKKYLFYGKETRHIRYPVPDAHADSLEKAKSCIRLLHGVIGMCTEAAEAADALLKFIFGDLVLDRVNLFEECGDMTWYLRLVADELSKVNPDHSFAKMISTNIEKLRARYPEKFSEDLALNRDLAIERNILEGQPTEGSK